MNKPVITGITGVTRATTVAELSAAATTAPEVPSKLNTTLMGLSTGTVPSTYTKYPTYAKQISGKSDIFLTGTKLFPGTPQIRVSRAPGAGTVRNSYYIATTAAKGATSPAPGNPMTTGTMIGWPVVITGGAIPAGSVFRTTVDSYHTMNDMTWDGYRYGTFTFNPEPPAPNGPYDFFFAPTVKGGRRRRGSKRSGSKRRGRKGTRRAF